MQYFYRRNADSNKYVHPFDIFQQWVHVCISIPSPSSKLGENCKIDILFYNFLLNRKKCMLFTPDIVHGVGNSWFQDGWPWVKGQGRIGQWTLHYQSSQYTLLFHAEYWLQDMWYFEQYNITLRSWMFYLSKGHLKMLGNLQNWHFILLLFIEPLKIDPFDTRHSSWGGEFLTPRWMTLGQMSRLQRWMNFALSVSSNHANCTDTKSNKYDNVNSCIHNYYHVSITKFWGIFPHRGVWAYYRRYNVQPRFHFVTLSAH